MEASKASVLYIYIYIYIYRFVSVFIFLIRLSLGKKKKYWGTILFIISCVGYGITQIGIIKLITYLILRN